MDLEHVCVVHRRWFANLRVRVQRPDYVEYRLTGLFYGLRQEVLARGAPIDADHYWYEFRTRLACMRVDGALAGPDGNLSQTEVITFNFSALLAPLFWMLRPLFTRQKQDILKDDTALLEREYELEQRGFQRHEPDQPRIVVYGGNGFFGRTVVRDLLAHTMAHVDIASRSGRSVNFPGSQNRVRFFESNLRDISSVRQTITGADLVIVAAGPFQGMPLTILEACLQEGVSYIDVADDREFVRRGYELAEHANAKGTVILIGCSVVPGLTSLLTRFAQRAVKQVEQTKICISPGTRHPRGAGSFACLLSTVCQPFTAPTHGREEPVIGWTQPERVTFPAPMGRRTAYRVVDIADHFIQPHYFGTKTVEFRIGSESRILNWLLSLLRAAIRILRLPATLLIPISRALIYLAAPFGSTAGGVLVEVSGLSDGQSRAESWCVYAVEGGERIPSLIPAIAAEMVLSGQFRGEGLVPLPDWITLDRLSVELNQRGIQIAMRDESGDWAGPIQASHVARQ